MPCSTKLNDVATYLREDHTKAMDDILEELSIQGKFKDVTRLKEENKAWNWLVTSLLVGQLSFILRGGMNCHPTPLNLRHWRYHTDPSCTLCSSSHPTSLHILNGCPEAQNQGHYTWCYDSVLLCLLTSLGDHIPVNSTIFAYLPYHIPLRWQ